MIGGPSVCVTVIRLDIPLSKVLPDDTCISPRVFIIRLMGGFGLLYVPPFLKTSGRICHSIFNLPNQFPSPRVLI